MYDSIDIYLLQACIGFAELTVELVETKKTTGFTFANGISRGILFIFYYISGNHLLIFESHNMFYIRICRTLLFGRHVLFELYA